MTEQHPLERMEWNVEATYDYGPEPLIMMRCSGGTQRGLRCRKRSGWLPERSAPIEWYCRYHEPEG